MPWKPGSTKPAVACTIRPRRPIELLPSMRATMSSGSSTRSSVRPSTNSPGWMTNGSSLADRDLLGEVGRRVAQVDRRRRGGCGRRGRSRRGAGRSTRAGPARAPTGSMTIRPSSARRRIVPSERTEVGTPRQSSQAQRSSSWRARARTGRTRGGGSGSGSPCGPRRGVRGSGSCGCGRGLRSTASRRRRRPRPAPCPGARPTTRARTASGSGSSGRRTGRASSSPSRPMLRPVSGRRRDCQRAAGAARPRSSRSAAARPRGRRSRRRVSDWIRSVPNASTLNDAIAVP